MGWVGGWFTCFVQPLVVRIHPDREVGESKESFRVHVRVVCVGGRGEDSADQLAGALFGEVGG